MARAPKPKILTLTEEHRAMFPAWIARWSAIGTSTEPADFVRAEYAIRRYYAFAKLKEPRFFVRVASPLAMAFTGPILAELIENVGFAKLVKQASRTSRLLADDDIDIRTKVGRAMAAATESPAIHGPDSDTVRQAIGYSIPNQSIDVDQTTERAMQSLATRAEQTTIKALITDAVHASVRGLPIEANPVRGERVDRVLWASIHQAVDLAIANTRPLPMPMMRDELERTVAQAVEEIATDAIKTSVSSNWWRYHGGQFWAGYPAWVTFIRDVLGVELPIDPFEEVALSCGWWWPHTDFCVITDRPRLLDRDADGRLHHPSRQAIEWRDGWGIHLWHGVRVAPDIIEHPEAITAARITNERNNEIRRIMLERMTPARYIKEAGATMVHRDDWGTLWRAEMTGDEPLVMVEVLNSTPEPDGSFHTYFLRVHPELRPMLAGGRLGPAQAMTALNAIASTFRLTGEEYAKYLLIQT